MRNNRPGITLAEVLVAIFIMGVGMLAILVLFPLGALHMADALRTDRAIQCVSQATAIANALDLRRDPAVTAGLDKTTPPSGDMPSVPVYVDPFAQTGTIGTYNYPPGAGGAPSTPGLVRVSQLMGGATGVGQRWFMLLDDLNFNADGSPAGVAGSSVQRYGSYSWVFIARRPQHGTPSVVDLTVVVFKGRNVLVPPPETAFEASGAADGETVTMTVPAGGEPELRPRGYLLDVTQLTSPPTVAGQVYRVTDIQKTGTAWTLRVEPPLRNAVNVVVPLEGAIAAYEKGTGWQP